MLPSHLVVQQQLQALQGIQDQLVYLRKTQDHNLGLCIERESFLRGILIRKRHPQKCLLGQKRSFAMPLENPNRPDLLETARSGSSYTLGIELG